MEQVVINAAPRTVIGKQVKQLRRQGLVPGILYGYGIEPMPLQFEAKELERVVRQAGSSTLVQVIVEEVPYTAVVREVQRDAIKRYIKHVDFQALSMTEKVRLPISLTLVGEAPAESQGATILQQLNEIEVECLPSALVHTIEVDISKLTEPGQVITAKDLEIPEGIELLVDPDEVIVIAAAEEEEEEVIGEEGMAATAEPEVITEKKEEAEG